MLYRLKFRVYRNQEFTKYACNLREGATLYVAEDFLPAADAESAHYCLMARSGTVFVSFLKADQWLNSNPVPKEPREMRPGYVLTGGGTTVEILECPQPSSGKTKSRETTQFIDVHEGFQTKSLNQRIFEPQPARTPPPFAPLPKQVGAPIAVPAQEETESPDKIVIPASLDFPADKATEMKNQPSQADHPQSQLENLVPGANKNFAKSVLSDPVRKKTYQRFLGTAAAVVAVILFANIFFTCCNLNV